MNLSDSMHGTGCITLALSNIDIRWRLSLCAGHRNEMSRGDLGRMLYSAKAHALSAEARSMR